MSKRFIFALAVILATSGLAQAGILVHFDPDEYHVNPGETFDVQILLDMDDSISGDQVPATGLRAMGIMMAFDGANAVVANTDAITLPDDLNGNGIGGPAYKDVGSGFAGAAGALNLSATEGRTEPLLVTISVTNLAPLETTYTLELGLYFQPVGDNFVQYGEIQNFDSNITFGSAIVIVPEPMTMALLGLGGLAILRRRRSA